MRTTHLAPYLFAGFLVTVPYVLLAVDANAQDGRQAGQTEAYGKTYGEWAANWIQWAEAGPVGRNAITDTTGEFCDDNQPKGPVWFLAGTFGKVGVKRNCTIPRDRALFYPLVEGGWVDCPGTEDPNTSDADVRAAIAVALDAACQVTSTLDGVPISALQVQTVRAQSPKFRNILPNDLVPEVANSCTPALVGGRTGRRIADGYWVMLPPLSPGAHTLMLHGGVCAFPDPNDNSDPKRGRVVFENGVTYRLTVSGKDR